MSNKSKRGSRLYLPGHKPQPRDVEVDREGQVRVDQLPPEIQRALAEQHKSPEAVIATMTNLLQMHAAMLYHVGLDPKELQDFVQAVYKNFANQVEKFLAENAPPAEEDQGA